MVGWEIESHDEVTNWLQTCTDAEWLMAEGQIDLLAELGNMLRLPHSKPLHGGLFELRFNASRRAWRITYWFAPQRVIVLLTVFHKQRDNEAGEVARARAAMQECHQQHP